LSQTEKILLIFSARTSNGTHFFKYTTLSNFYQEFKKHWAMWLSAGFFVIIFGLLSLGEFQNWSRLKGEIKENELKIHKLNIRAEQVSADIVSVSDPNYLEKEARLTLNLKQEGEEVFVVVGLDDITQEEDFTSVFSGPVEPKGKLWFNVKDWWDYFFTPSE